MIAAYDSTSSLCAQYRSRVLRDGRVRGQQDDALDLRLCSQDAVERIFVVRGQARHGDDVPAGHGKLDIAVVERARSQDAGIKAEVGST